MASRNNPCPMPRIRVIDEYFLEHRSKLLDIAAFLDRVDRAPTESDRKIDFRINALCQAVHLLNDGQPNRAQRILEHLSDRTTEPLESAPTKAAAGAPTE